MKRFDNIKTPALFVVVALFAGCAAISTELIPPSINQNDGFPPGYIDKYTEIEFRLLPAGQFTMGSPDDEAGRDGDESPAHTVTIDSFYISKYEVTAAQWKKVMGNNPSNNKGHPTLPVENTSWHNAREFIISLNKTTALKYRLPTEAEWEYACRAGTQTPFYAGTDNKTLNEYAWYHTNSAGETHPVGTRLPNKWGLYDMHGNVSEWVADGMRGYLSRTEHNPKGIQSSQKAIHRGGCWLYPARLCRSANRMISDKNFRTHIIGFRLAIDKKNINK